jgi:hypothetical protein
VTARTGGSIRRAASALDRLRRHRRQSSGLPRRTGARPCGWRGGGRDRSLVDVAAPRFGNEMTALPLIVLWPGAERPLFFDDRSAGFTGVLEMPSDDRAPCYFEHEAAASLVFRHVAHPPKLARGRQVRHAHFVRTADCTSSFGRMTAGHRIWIGCLLMISALELGAVLKRRGNQSDAPNRTAFKLAGTPGASSHLMLDDLLLAVSRRVPAVPPFRFSVFEGHRDRLGFGCGERARNRLGR